VLEDCKIRWKPEYDALVIVFGEWGRWLFLYENYEQFDGNAGKYGCVGLTSFAKAPDPIRVVLHLSLMTFCRSIMTGFETETKNCQCGSR